MIQPGVEGIANLVFDVPPSARGVKGGIRQGDDESKSTPCLFEVQCIVGVKMSMGFGRYARRSIELITSLISV